MLIEIVQCFQNKINISHQFQLLISCLHIGQPNLEMVLADFLTKLQFQTSNRRTKLSTTQLRLAHRSSRSSSQKNSNTKNILKLLPKTLILKNSHISIIYLRCCKIWMILMKILHRLMFMQ
jgi:hypothetical protein